MRTAQVIRCYPKRVSLCIVFRVRLTEEHVLIMWGLAQLGERLLCKQEVSGSIPLISTMWVASSAG